MTSDSSNSAQCAVHLRKTVSLLSRRLRTNLRSEISTGKLSVIGQLYRAGSMTPTALAAYEGVKIQTLTRLLAELEADGWLIREANPIDRRQSLLTITKSGEKRLIAAVKVGEASLAKVIDTLSAEERALLLQACTLLDGIATALTPSAPVGDDAGAPSKVNES